MNMKWRHSATMRRAGAAFAAGTALLAVLGAAPVPPGAADLYDLFGFPAPAGAGADRVVIALTFAPTPVAGRLDPDLLYRLRLYPAPRPATGEDLTLEAMLAHWEAVRARYLRAPVAEVRVRAEGDHTARVSFHAFPAGDFGAIVPLGEATTVNAPDGTAIPVFVGGRGDIPRDDLTEISGAIRKPPAGPGVNAIVLQMPLDFVTRASDTDRIVNVWGESWVLRPAPGRGPVPRDSAPPPATAWAIPSGLVMLGGVVLFVALWSHTPVAPVARTFGVATIGGVILLAGAGVALRDRLTRVRLSATASDSAEAELGRYRRIDTEGQHFARAALDGRTDEAQDGGDALFTGPAFVRRLADLGRAFGPSLSALGLVASIDRDPAPVPARQSYTTAAEAFPPLRRALLQRLNMPDDSWNPRHLAIPLRRPFEIFVPDVCAIDMDTTGTWPFGRRLEDQVATRFLSLFLDMSATWNGRPYHVDLLGDPALRGAAPGAPGTPPPSLRHDDQPFLATFPYLAAPR